MAILNQYLCESLFGNTGYGQCALIPKEIKGYFIVPRNFVITQANADDLQTFMANAANADSPTSRIYPVHNLVALTDNSEEPVTETLGYGGVVTIRQGNYSWMLRFIDGGLCLLIALQQFNGQPVSVIFYDSDGVLFGRQTPTGLAGVPVINFNANKWTPGDGSVLAGFTTTITFDSLYLNKQLGFVKDENFDPTSVMGLQDLAIKVLTASAASATVQVVSGCGGENVYDLFSAQLAAPGVWDVVGTDGSAQTIDAVAAVPAQDAFTISFTPVRTVGSRLNLAAVSVLDAAGIVGFEGKPVTVPLTLP